MEEVTCTDCGISSGGLDMSAGPTAVEATQGLALDPPAAH